MFFIEPEFQALSEDVRDLILQMLTFDYKNRPPAAELLKHRWFKQVVHKEISPGVLKNLNEFHVQN